MTHSLVCHETRQKVWIGQGGPEMRVFYSGEQETMRALGRFLQATIGKPLVVLCNDCHDEIAGYESFEDQRPEE